MMMKMSAVDHHYSIEVPFSVDHGCRNRHNSAPIRMFRNFWNIRNYQVIVCVQLKPIYSRSSPSPSELFFFIVSLLTCLIGIRLIDGVIWPSCNKFWREFCSALVIKDCELVGAFESADGDGDGDPPFVGRLVAEPVGIGSDWNVQLKLYYTNQEVLHIISFTSPWFTWPLIIERRKHRVHRFNIILDGRKIFLFYPLVWRTIIVSMGKLIFLASFWSRNHWIVINRWA